MFVGGFYLCVGGGVVEGVKNYVEFVQWYGQENCQLGQVFLVCDVWCGDDQWMWCGVMLVEVGFNGSCDVYDVVQVGFVEIGVGE